MKLSFSLTFALFISLGLSLQVNAQNALHFDGIDDHVETTYAGIPGTGARTIEAWINTSANCDPNNGGKQKIIADYGVFTTGGRFTFSILFGNAIRLEVGGSGLSGKIAVNDGRRHHVAAVYSPIARNPISLYVDGVLDTAGNIPTPINTGNSIGFTIGERVDGINNFDGSIDEVRFWDVPRTIADIQLSRNTEICTHPNLKAYYQANQGSAFGTNTGLTTLNDNSGGANNGTLSGFALSGMSSNWVSGATLTPAGGVTTATINPTSCGNYTSPSGNHTWATTGMYMDVIPNSTGCDSVLTINLTVTSLDLSIINNANVLVALEPSATYQWLNCTNGYAQVSGATMQAFTPSSNGQYAVELKKASCVDTSGCISVSGLAVLDQDLSHFKVYPNPIKEAFFIDLSNSTSEVSVRIVDAIGKEIYRNSYDTAALQRLELNAPRGIYYLELKPNDKRFVRKLIKS